MKKAMIIMLVIIILATLPALYAGSFPNGDLYWGVAFSHWGIGNGQVYICPTFGYFDKDAGKWVDGRDNPFAPLLPGLVVDC